MYIIIIIIIARSIVLPTSALRKRSRRYSESRSRSNANGSNAYWFLGALESGSTSVSQTDCVQLTNEDEDEDLPQDCWLPDCLLLRASSPGTQSGHHAVIERKPLRIYQHTD